MQALFSVPPAHFYLVENAFGNLVARRRLDQNLSQRELARRIGKSATYINYVEQGKNPASRSGLFKPTVEAVDKIAKVLSIPQNEARQAAGYAGIAQEPQTVKELVERLWDLGIQINFADDLLVDNSPDALERAKASIAAIMQAQFGKFA